MWNRDKACCIMIEEYVSALIFDKSNLRWIGGTKTTSIWDVPFSIVARVVHKRLPSYRKQTLAGRLYKAIKVSRFIMDWNSILIVSFVRVSLCLPVYRGKRNYWIRLRRIKYIEPKYRTNVDKKKWKRGNANGSLARISCNFCPWFNRGNSQVSITVSFVTM